MKADAVPVGYLLAEKRRFIVPVYQRHYAWQRDPDLAAFWDDVAGKAEERLEGQKRRYAHYMGALIVTPAGDYDFARVTTLNVVDGQQRLTTFQLFLAAARDVARGFGLEGMVAQIEAHLLNGDERLMKDPETERYKVQPTLFDRNQFYFLITATLDEVRQAYPQCFFQNGNLKVSSASRMLSAWCFFRERIEAFTQADRADPDARARRLEELWGTLVSDFKIVVISLEVSDDAQVIFSTLNGRGQPLLAMDLVRNDVFQRAAALGEDQDKLFRDLWSKFEEPFWEELVKQGRLRKPRIEFFLANMLTAETGDEVSFTKLFPEYRHYATKAGHPNVANEVKNLVDYAPAYRMLTAPTGESALARIARSLAMWDLTTAFPLVMLIERSDAPEPIKERLYALINAYIVRRALCGLTNKNYNKNFLRMIDALKVGGVTEEAFSASLSTQTGDAVRFPGDAELREGVLSKAAYANVPARGLKAVLSSIELALRDRFDEAVTLPAELQVEHILPRRWRRTWPLPDGRLAPESEWAPASDEVMAEAIRARSALVDTLGNLSLLTPASNASASNGAFADKHVRFTNSLLKINREVASSGSWTEDAIETRGRRLAECCVALWPAPTSMASVVTT